MSLEVEALSATRSRPYRPASILPFSFPAIVALPLCGIPLRNHSRSFHSLFRRAFASLGRPLIGFRRAVRAALSLGLLLIHRMSFPIVMLEKRRRAAIRSGEMKRLGPPRRAEGGLPDRGAVQRVGSTRRFSSRCSPPNVAAHEAAAAPTSSAAAVRNAVSTAVLRARSAACLAVSLACEIRA